MTSQWHTIVPQLTYIKSMLQQTFQLRTILCVIFTQPRSQGVLPSNWAGGKEKARSPGNEVDFHFQLFSGKPSRAIISLFLIG